MSYDQYAWKETEPGRWQRATDEVEHFYFALAKAFEGSNRMFFAVTGHIILEAKPLPGLSIEETEKRLDAALRTAWLAVRWRYPTVASQVILQPGARTSIKVYQSPQKEEDLESWANTTLVSVSERLTGQEWANSDPPAPSVPKLFVLRPAGTSLRRDLVLRSPHETVDGIGALQMLGQLVTEVSNAYGVSAGEAEAPRQLGSEIVNLSPPYRVAANVPAELTPDQQQQLERMNEQKKAASQGTDSVPVLALPYKQGETRPGRHQRAHLWLTEEQTSNLLKACKGVGATVTHVFHAAIAMAVRDVQDDRVANATTGQYVSYILRNERPSCIAPYNSTDHCVSVYHSVSGQALVVDLDLSVGESSSRTPSAISNEFSPILDKVRDFYHQVRDQSDHYIFAPSFWSAATPQLPEDGSIPPVPPPSSSPSVSLSSMGRVDSIVPSSQGEIEAHDPWVTGEELGAGLGVFLGTFRGRLCLSAAYNDAWHDGKEVMKFLERCREITMTSLARQ